MNVKRFVSVSVLAATCVFSFNTLNAQTLARDKGPAEIPPSSAAPAPVQIETTRPAATAVAAAPAAVAPKSPAPIRATRNTIASVLAPNPVRTVASKPLVKQRVAPSMISQRPARPSTFRQDPPRVRAAAPAQIQPRRVQAQPRIVRVAPTPQVQQPRRVVTNTQRQAVGAQVCRGASAVSQQYIGRRGNTVRCGPQQGAFVTRAGDVKGGTFRAANGQVLNTASLSPNAIVVPRHVYEKQQAARLSSGNAARNKHWVEKGKWILFGPRLCRAV